VELLEQYHLQATCAFCRLSIGMKALTGWRVEGGSVQSRIDSVCFITSEAGSKACPMPITVCY